MIFWICCHTQKSVMASSVARMQDELGKKNIYIYIYKYIYIYTHTYIYIYTHTHTHTPCKRWHVNQDIVTCFMFTNDPLL